jgi:hypothetical protein
MYDNVMNKFRFGNYKTARYLDHESTNMFYPVLVTTFLDLARGLERDGHPDLALKALHKYDAVLPDLFPYIDIAGRKLFMAQIAYRLHDVALGNKIVNGIDRHLTDQLDFNYYQLKNNGTNLNLRDVQISLEVLNGMARYTTGAGQNQLSNKFNAQLKDYEAKFAGVLGR